jgi:hypothetical protein
MLDLLHFPTSSGGILQKGSVDGGCRQMDVSHNTSSDEDVLNRALLRWRISSALMFHSLFISSLLSYHVRVLEVVQYGDIVELDVEVLVDALQGSTDRNVILELHRNLWYTCQNRAPGRLPHPCSD